MTKQQNTQSDRESKDLPSNHSAQNLLVQNNSILCRSSLDRIARREFLVLGAGALAVAALPWMTRRREQLFRRSLPLMGTIAEIGVVHENERFAQSAIDAAFAALLSVERAMTRFDAHSEVGRANRLAARTATQIGVETAKVIEAALLWAQASEGRFDPALGRLVTLWNVNHRHTPPLPDVVQRFAARGLYRAIDVSKTTTRGWVSFADAEVALDLGGIAKGYGVDRAVAALRNLGVKSGLVNVGGDLYALGHTVSREAWRVGVLDARQPGQIAQIFELADAAVATSGDYFQFFDYQGRRYHHLLDPKTASPHESVRHSLTVMAERCMDADAAATTLFGVGQAEALRILQVRAPGARILAA